MAPRSKQIIFKKISLATTGIHCMISWPLSGAMEDCSIVRIQQLQMLCRRRCYMSASQCMFGLLCNVVVAHEHQYLCEQCS